jgi:hypothetical protein
MGRRARRRCLGELLGVFSAFIDEMDDLSPQDDVRGPDDALGAFRDVEDSRRARFGYRSTPPGVAAKLQETPAGLTERTTAPLMPSGLEELSGREATPVG